MNDWNFVLDAGPGCHIARKDDDAASKWVIEWEDVDVDDFEGETIPDLAIDPEESTLTLCNVRKLEHVVAYISVYDTVLRDREGSAMQQGTTTDNQNVSQPCTTLIVLCPPGTFAHLCYLDLPADGSLENLRIESDVQEWSKHRDAADTHSQTIGFPLQGPGPYRCTQGESGHLTHFFAGNLHAIDFACPVGTPLLAVGDGVVVDCKDNNSLTGIAVSNMFEWNSILLQLDTTKTVAESSSAIGHEGEKLSSGPLFVEYVHIQKVTVQAGERVQAGQVIGLSGSVGFSPEPHLHFAAYRSQNPTAATVRVYSHSTKDRQTTFLPKAGLWYDATGPVQDHDLSKPSS
jgi:hypothetical protein